MNKMMAAEWVNRESRGSRLVDKDNQPRSSDELLEYARILVEEARLAGYFFTDVGIHLALAREAEIALGSLAFVTDYDCWREDEEDVSAAGVVEHMRANSAAARRVLLRVVPRIPTEPDWPEHRALDGAIMTARDLWPPETVKALAPILERVG